MLSSRHFLGNRLLIVSLSLLFLNGAAEFPSTEPGLIDEVLDEEDYFEDEVSYDFDIPRVSERPYGEEVLPRLPVEAVLVRKVTAHPEKDITQESKFTTSINFISSGEHRPCKFCFISAARFLVNVVNRTFFSGVATF